MMTTFLPPASDIDEAKFLILVLKVSINRPSSEPFITITSQPISSHMALATVVLPTPAPPDKRRFGILL